MFMTIVLGVIIFLLAVLALCLANAIYWEFFDWDAERKRADREFYRENGKRE